MDNYELTFDNQTRIVKLVTSSGKEASYTHPEDHAVPFDSVVDVVNFLVEHISFNLNSDTGKKGAVLVIDTSQIIKNYVVNNDLDIPLGLDLLKAFVTVALTISWRPLEELEKGFDESFQGFTCPVSSEVIARYPLISPEFHFTKEMLEKRNLTLKDAYIFNKMVGSLIVDSCCTSAEVFETNYAYLLEYSRTLGLDTSAMAKFCEMQLLTVEKSITSSMSNYLDDLNQRNSNTSTTLEVQGE